MEEVKDVILNVYTLSVTPEMSSPQQEQQSNRTSNTNNSSDGTHTTNTGSSRSWSSFFVSKMLPSIGMGAYHTSLRIGSGTSARGDDGPYSTTYTFVANRGIVTHKRSNTSRVQSISDGGVPSHATFKEEIVLGSCMCHRGQIADIIELLSSQYFTSTSYHLVHRNCNHFTETLATALIHYSDFMRRESAVTSQPVQKPLKSIVPLSTYPNWINRLANTGATVISHDSDIIPCQPSNEAYHAVTKVRFLNGNVDITVATSAAATNKQVAAKKTTKKELTDAQKKLLEKIRG
jgi:PPPDE putative peptidase domain